MRRFVMLAVSAAALSFARPAHAQAGDIVQTVAAEGSFTMLTRLLNDAGLTGTLKGPGPYTLFAPTDAAFAKVPASTLASNKSALRDVLLYHVVAGKVSAADIARLNGKGAKTFQGAEAKVTTSGEGIMIGTANVTKADIQASNGVIHVIDAVLLPPK